MMMMMMMIERMEYLISGSANLERHLLALQFARDNIYSRSAPGAAQNSPRASR